MWTQEIVSVPAAYFANVSITGGNGACAALSAGNKSIACVYSIWQQLMCFFSFNLMS